MATKTKTQDKTQLLRNLIEHPRTSEDERNAAKRALERLLAKKGQSVKSEDTRPEWYDTRTYGVKYEHGVWYTAAQIAKMIRNDVKVALKLAKADAEPGAVAVVDPLALIPKGVKVGVVSESFAGGRSVDIVLRNVPEEWGYSLQESHYIPGKMERRPSPEMKAVAKALKALMDAYNYDGSDYSTDYFDVNFYGHVQNEHGLILA